jgi:hypothetical protein
MVSTVVLYVAVSVLVLPFVRPSLAPQVFIRYPQGSVTGLTRTEIAELTGSWQLGFGYRYAPGSRDNGPSASVEGQRCESRNQLQSGYEACLSRHHIQEGNFLQPANHYWELQWGEAGLLLVASGALLGTTVWSVRWWTA